MHQRRVDLYVTDFRLSGSMNGVELLAALQARSPVPLKAVVITGDTAAKVLGSLDAAPWKVLHKPIEPAKLLSAIAELCREPA